MRDRRLFRTWGALEIFLGVRLAATLRFFRLARCGMLRQIESQAVGVGVSKAGEAGGEGRANVSLRTVVMVVK